MKGCHVMSYHLPFTTMLLEIRFRLVLYLGYFLHYNLVSLTSHRWWIPAPAFIKLLCGFLDSYSYGNNTAKGEVWSFKGVI